MNWLYFARKMWQRIPVLRGILLLAFCLTTATSTFALGEIDTNFNASFGPYALKIQTDNKILAGGASGIVRLNTNGSLDGSFSCNVTGEVWCIDIQDDGKILIGGKFSSVNGVTRTNVARLDASGGLDTGFSAGNVSDFVFAVVAQPGGGVLIGGEFTSVGGVSKKGVARLNGNGSLDGFFDTGTGVDAVRSIALQPDGRVIIGGVFSSVGGIPRSNVARLSSTGSVDLAFAPTNGPNAAVMSVALQADGKIIIGGDFTVVGGVTNVRIARLNVNGTVDTNFNAGSGASGIIGGQPVWAVTCRENGDVFLVGGFSKLNDVTRNGLAKLHSDGALDTDFVPGLAAASRGYAVAVQPDGNVLFGGATVYRLMNFPPSTGPATSAIGMYAGVTIQGTVGGRYRIEYSTDLNPTNWQFLKELILPSSPYLYFDASSLGQPKRFYRVLQDP